MLSVEQNRIEALREREWRGTPLTAEEAGELAAFYQRLEQAEDRYLDATRMEQQARIEERTQTLSELQTLLHEKQSRLARIRSLIREIQELEAAESRLLSGNAR